MRGKGFLAWLIVALTLVSSQAFPQNPDTARKEDQAKGTETDVPSMEILEFLGEWETDDGKWIDPMELDEIALPDEEQQKDEN